MQAEPASKIDSVETKDGRQYKIQRELFCQYSPFYQTMIQESSQQVFRLYSINSTEFDYIFQFMQLHKKNPPLPLSPIHPGISLKSVMEEADAELVNRVFENPPEKIKAVVDAAYFLHMNELLQRLTAGMLSHLNKGETKKLVQESKKSDKVKETQVSQQIHDKIKMVFKAREEEAKQKQAQENQIKELQKQ